MSGKKVGNGAHIKIRHVLKRFIIKGIVPDQSPLIANFGIRFSLLQSATNAYYGFHSLSEITLKAEGNAIKCRLS